MEIVESSETALPTGKLKRILNGSENLSLNPHEQAAGVIATIRIPVGLQDQHILPAYQECKIE